MRVGGQRQAAAALPPGKRPNAHCTVGWVSPTTGLDGCRGILYFHFIYSCVRIQHASH